MNCQHTLGHIKRKAILKKTSTSASLTTVKPLIVWITTDWDILIKEMEIPDHITYLLRNLYAGQETTVRAARGTADWFKVGEGVHEGCIL